MIVKNEEAVLERCLTSVQNLADEIIIVDTGSCDRTKEIAKKFTDKVYDFVWIDDFSAARNFAFSKAKNDYLMWLDADDVIEETDLKLFLEVKSGLDGKTDVIFAKYNVAYCTDGTPSYCYYRERIIKNCIAARFDGFIHEAVTPFGNTRFVEAAVSHRKAEGTDPTRNLKIFEKNIKAGKTLSPRLRYYYGRELMYNGKQKKAITVLEKFLKDGDGWTENCISACDDLGRCYLELGNEDSALRAYFSSFAYDLPRPDILCHAALIYFNRGDYNTASYWYSLAIAVPKNENNLGFIQPDYYGFIPALQLCVIFDKLNEKETAYSYNEYAASIKPDDSSVLYNRKYFNSLGIGNV